VRLGNWPAGRPGALRRALEEHLGSRDVARVVYGAVIGLALVLALQQHRTSAEEATGALVGTAVAVGLAELYSDLVGFEARSRRAAGGAQVRDYAAGAVAVTLGAGFPAIFFVLAMSGAIDVDTAFTAAKWTGLALLCAYGFLAARLSGSGVGRSILHAAAVGAVGGILIVIKALLH
jgi:hypothetical protein